MNTFIEICVTEEQKKQLERQAKHKGCSISDYIVALARKDRLKRERRRYTYRVNYGYGTEKARIETLKKAMKKADTFVARTGKNISIEKEGSVVAFRQWRRGTEGFIRQKNPIRFGNRGYYADWVVLKN